VVAAAVLVLSVCGSKSEQKLELLTDNVEALTESEGVKIYTYLCVWLPNFYCVVMSGSTLVVIGDGIIIG